jgi:hypothetical protein
VGGGNGPTWQSTGRYAIKPRSVGDFYVGRLKQCLHFKRENRMWKCKNCSEQVENNFGSCWNCGYSRDGSPPEKGGEVSAEAVLPNGQLLSQVVASGANSRARATKQPERQEVVVVDVSVPFGSMVVFMVKWAIASIPAFLILIILGVIVGGVLGSIGGTIFR